MQLHDLKFYRTRYAIPYVINAIVRAGLNHSPDGCCMEGTCRCNGPKAQFWPRVAVACWYFENTGSIPRAIQLNKTRIPMKTLLRWCREARKAS